MMSYRKKKSNYWQRNILIKKIEIFLQEKKVQFEDGLLINIKDISSLEIKENKSYFDYQ